MMQMTMDQAARPGFLLAFALRRGSGYVMRSEKRQGYGSGNNNPRRRRPRRRRPSALYIILTVLVSILLWPVGMVLLWRRKVRLQAGTKLLMSLITLCLSVFLIVFLLTVPVENERITAAQDAANDWLDGAYKEIAVVGDAAWNKGVETWNVMYDFGQKTVQPVTATVADGLEKGVELAGIARDRLLGLFGSGVDAPQYVENTPEPSPTAGAALSVHIPAETPDSSAATPLEAGMLSADGEFHPGETPAPSASEAPADTPESSETPAPTEQAKGEAKANAAPNDETDVSEGSPAFPETATMEDAEGEPDSAEDQPEGTIEPELALQPQAAGEAIVYYKSAGKQYHMGPECGEMTGAQPHTLREAVDAGKQRCETCGTPDASILSFSFVAWVDEAGLYHTSANCERFAGQWQLMPLDSAISAGNMPCTACQADLYAERFGTVRPKIVSDDGTALKTADSGIDADEASPDASESESDVGEAGPEATEADGDPVAADDEASDAEGSADEGEALPPETADPTADADPRVPLKPAGEAIVYHSYNGKNYHSAETCKGMTASNPYKLSEIKGQYRRCAACDPPEERLIGQPCLWMDENSLCHTSDECEAFQGSFKLIPVDDARSQNLEGCPDCGADAYLIPDDAQ